MAIKTSTATKTKASKSITIGTVRKKAEALGVKPGKMKKAELIHAIQIAEGYSPCFGTSDGQCPYTDCCFMHDCFKAARKVA